MHRIERLRAIEELRAAIADGARDIERVYFPLLTHLVAIGERRDAAEVGRAAAAVALANRRPYDAACALRRARDADPANLAVRRAIARLRATIARDDPVLFPAALLALGPSTPEVRTLVERLDARERWKFLRCALAWREGHGNVCSGTLDLVQPVAPSWLAACSVALELGGAPAPIPVTLTVVRVLPQVLTVRCAPMDAGAAAALAAHLRTTAPGSCSNLQFLRLAPPVSHPFRIANAYALPPSASPTV